jgi:hypothetical protein
MVTSPPTRRPITVLATRTTAAGPAFESRQGRKPRENGAALSAGAMEISVAAAVQLGSGRKAPVRIVGARRRRVGALRASIEQLVA